MDGRCECGRGGRSVPAYLRSVRKEWVRRIGAGKWGNAACFGSVEKGQAKKIGAEKKKVEKTGADKWSNPTCFRSVEKGQAKKTGTGKWSNLAYLRSAEKRQAEK